MGQVGRGFEYFNSPLDFWPEKTRYTRHLDMAWPEPSPGPLVVPAVHLVHRAARAPVCCCRAAVSFRHSQQQGLLEPRVGPARAAPEQQGLTARTLRAYRPAYRPAHAGWAVRQVWACHRC